MRTPASRLLGCLATIACLALLACGRGSSTATPTISLNDSVVDVAGLSSETLDALLSADLSPEQWSSVFRVAVGPDATPMLGSYTIDDRVVRFTPAFPLDAGRVYEARFDAARIPGVSGGPVLVASVGLPAASTESSTVVARIYPTGDTVPENVLRMYIEFSRPMGRKSGVEYITLLDDTGAVIPGAVLPLDYEFWSPDHTRFTVFFDPGRVKDGILPNREMGRAFTPGQTVTLVVNPEWRDEHGLPLKSEYRRTFRTTPADDRPIDPTEWRVTAPVASGRDPVVVDFPEPLDHGLLMRALGVRRDGAVVAGDAQVSENETRWSFTPTNAWTPATYQVLAFDILEDLAGNQVGRAFEVDNFDSVDKDPDPETVLLPFVVRSR